MNLPAILGLALWLAVAPPAATQTVETATTDEILLSGRGVDDAVPWEFRCDGAGRRCGTWSTIPVPSQWQQHGFGAYSYGHDDDKPDTVGTYRRTFTVPEAWSGRRIELVFDGVMTDAAVSINGRSLGPPHQGAFYRFRHPLGPLLADGSIVPGEPAQLEVQVRETSADRRVEAAERDADYWVFGGIFRSVRLLGHPAESIEHVAFDARADGTLRVRARLALGDSSPRDGRLLRVRLRPWSATGASQPWLGTATAPIDSRGLELTTRFRGIEPWSDERPNLYVARIELVRRDDSEAGNRSDRVLHRVEKRIGFRTVTIGPDGLEVNGVRRELRGVNRHVFWPDSGRASSPERARRDAERIAALHANAVRTSHYPPEEAFLDAADELGLYVIDELAGWHDAYGTATGRHLVRAMVERDAHHPSILFWANGNEGGWNHALDDEFACWDPAARPVLHPDAVFRGVDARHYPTRDELQARLDGSDFLTRWTRLFEPVPIVMPTEFLHGLYEGGAGAGMREFWDAIRAAPRGVGGFVWVFADEAIERTDRSAEHPQHLDTDGNHAPDGIVGPWREPSGDEAAMRAVWAPVQRTPEGLRNHFAETPNEAITVHARAVRLPRPGATRFAGDGAADDNDDGLETLATASASLAPAVDGLSAMPSFDFGSSLASGSLDEALVLEALIYEARLDLPSRGERVVGRWHELPSAPPSLLDRFQTDRPDGEASSAEGHREEPDEEFREASGEIVLTGADGSLRLGAPRPAHLQGVERRDAGARFDTRVVARGGGWIEITWRQEAAPGGEPMGLLLPFTWSEKEPEREPELLPEEVRAIEWFGLGPYRVWGNRMEGRLGHWRVEADETTAPRWGHGRKLDGFFEARWLRLETAAGDLVIVPDASTPIVSVLRPRFPADAEEAHSTAPALDGVALLAAAPTIGTKFYPADEISPRAKDPTEPSYLEGRALLWFGGRAEVPPD